MSDIPCGGGNERGGGKRRRRKRGEKETAPGAAATLRPGGYFTATIRDGEGAIEGDGVIRDEKGGGPEQWRRWQRGGRGGR